MFNSTQLYDFKFEVIPLPYMLQTTKFSYYICE